MDGSAIGYAGMAGAIGLIRDSSGFWVLGFSLKMGIATKNMAELELVRQGLLLAWELGFRFIQLELDSVTVLSWITDITSSYSLDVMSLICDCRSLMEQDWEVEACYIYREANGCANALAKQGTHQQQLLSIYTTCPSFVYSCLVRDLAGLGSSRLCA